MKRKRLIKLASIIFALFLILINVNIVLSCGPSKEQNASDNRKIPIKDEQ